MPLKPFHVRLGVAVEEAILKSGQKPSDWLREATEWRIEKEQASKTEKSPLEMELASLKRELESLKNSARELQKETLRHQRDHAALASDLSAIKDMQGRLKTQYETLNRMQIKMNEEFGEGLIELSASLLAGIGELLQAFAAAREPKKTTFFPKDPGPRRGL